MYPKNLLTLVNWLSKLPGVGKKTAERYAFDLLEWETLDLHSLAQSLSTIKEKVLHCKKCGCLCPETECIICTEERKNGSLCIIASPKDAIHIESTNVFQGLYHVLGSLISPLQGILPENLNLATLFERIKSENITEVILAFDPNLEGDATSLFLQDSLEKIGIHKVTKLALGLPLGSSLEYIDQATLSQALSGRQPMQ